MLTDEVSNLLTPPPSGTLLVITIGNSFRSDDGAGPYIATCCKEHGDRFRLIDAGSRPEDVVFDAIEIMPSRIVIIDAADFGGLPGDIAVIPDDAIDQKTFSTHSIPMSLFSSILREDTGAEVSFIGIQTNLTELGEGLSPGVKKSADQILERLMKIF